MTVKELRNLLYKANDEATVQIENCDIAEVVMITDLETDKETVRLFT